MTLEVNKNACMLTARNIKISVYIFDFIFKIAI